MKGEPRQRIVQLGDWLPPEFSAVGQYCLDLSMEEAAAGHQVTLVGLRTYNKADELIEVSSGSLNVISLRRPKYAKHNWLSRLAWSAVTNVLMIVRSWKDLRKADAIRFTG